MITLPKNMSEVRLPYIKDGGLTNQFIFSQAHFHWGLDSSRGSEHTIRKKRWTSFSVTLSRISRFKWLLSCSYAAEIHFVHFNKKYGSMGNATSHPDGLAVLGVFVEVTRCFWGRLTLRWRKVWLNRSRTRKTQRLNRWRTLWIRWTLRSTKRPSIRTFPCVNSCRTRWPSSTGTRDRWPLLPAMKSSRGLFLTRRFPCPRNRYSSRPEILHETANWDCTVKKLQVFSRDGEDF